MLTDHTRKTIQAILVAVFVAWISFGSWYSWQSSKSPHAPTNRQTAKQPDEKAAHYNPFYEFWQWTTHDAVSFYTFVLAIFTGILGSVAIVQIRYLSRADETARMAAEAAKKSANASLLALRPWVSCEAKIISDLTYRSNGDPCITIRFILKNNGHSPAMGVRLMQWFHLLSPVHTHSIHAQQRIADLLKGLPAQERGLLLFPGQTHVSDIELPISRIEIEKSIEDIKPKKHFFPELIGLVSYTYPLATHNPQTGFIFYLRKIVPDETYGFAFDLDEPIVPAGNITLRAHGLWSEYAT